VPEAFAPRKEQGGPRPVIICRDPATRIELAIFASPHLGCAYMPSRRTGPRIGRNFIPGTAGICVLRDASDIALLLCGHYLRIGIERLVFIDDGSSDGTFERLNRLAGRSRGRIEVERTLSEDYRQPELMTMAANGLIEQGFRLIMPFDADEFWNLSRADLAALMAHPEPRTIEARWVNFVQRRSRRYPSPFSLGHVRFRSADRGRDREIEQAVAEFTDAFVHFHQNKIAIWSEDPIVIDRGQHALRKGPSARDPSTFEILHLPLRAQSEITKRGLNYEARRRRVREDAGVSWQSLFHESVVRADRTAQVWAANSADRKGRLDVYGRPEPLIPDNRLRQALLAAALHLAIHYRISPF